MADTPDTPYGRDRFLEQLTELVQKLEFTSGVAGPQVQASGDIAATLDDLRKRIKESAEAFAKSLDKLADRAETAEKRYHYQAGAALARRSGNVSDEELYFRSQQAQGHALKSSVESYLDRILRARLGQFDPSQSDYAGIRQGGGAASAPQEMPWQKAFREFEEEKVRKEQDRQRYEEEYQARKQEDDARAAQAKRQETEAAERLRKEQEAAGQAMRDFFQQLHEQGVDEENEAQARKAARQAALEQRAADARALAGSRKAMGALAAAEELAGPPAGGIPYANAAARRAAAALPAEHVPFLNTSTPSGGMDWKAWAEAEEKVFQVRKKEPELYERTARTLDSNLGITAVQVGMKLAEMPGVAMAGIQHWVSRMDRMANMAGLANPNVGATYEGSKRLLMQAFGEHAQTPTRFMSAQMQAFAHALHENRPTPETQSTIANVLLGMAPTNVGRALGLIKNEHVDNQKENIVNMSPSRTLSAEEYSDVITQAGFQRQDLANEEAQNQMRNMVEQMQSLHSALQENTNAIQNARPIFHQ